MPEQLTRQERLFGEREEVYGEITVPNAHLYPFVRVVSSLAEECKLRHSDGQISARAIDPANVGMIDVSLDVESDADEFVTGVNADYLAGRLQNKPRSEPNPSEITLDLADPNSTLQVSTEVGDEIEATFTDRFGTIDPGLIREEPDMPELDRDTSAEAPLSVVKHFVTNSPTDHAIEFTTDDGQLLIGQIGEEAEYDALAEIGTDLADGDASALYTKDYLKSITKALDSAGVETVELVWADESPMSIYFETDYGLEGEFMNAPRIQREP